MSVNHKHNHNKDVSEQEANVLLQEHQIDDQVHKFANLETSQTELDSVSETHVPVIAWVVAVALLILGLFLVYKAFFSTNINIPSVSEPVIESSTPTPTPRNTPTPTPIPEKTRSSVKVRVLNGSGTPGLAGVAKSFLESLGYTSIDTGNADRFTYSTTQISVRPGLDTMSKTITDDLKDKYSLSQEVGELPSTGAYDIEIILGSK